jgi:HD-GYP domain-containing protein (c-di-GMP phosphodiesterase class II)
MSAQAAGDGPPGGVRLARYLPLSVGVTLAVTALPLVAVSQLGPARSPLHVALHVLAAVTLSVLLARLLAAIWKRHEQSTDLLFGDLLIWGWARRALAERRLDAATREIAEPAAADETRVGVLRRMSNLLEARDPYTHGHSRRVARHAERIAVEIGLSSEQVAKIRAAALVHDLGKINIPRSILNKPDALTDGEFALVKRHAADGAALVSALNDPELTAIVRHHHERMDGTGYPDGLAGGDIPIGARVIAVADTFDAITSARAYRKTRTHKQAIQILKKEAGPQLDASAVAAFVSYYAARRSVGWASMLAAAPQRLISSLGGVQSGVAAGVAPIAQTACGVGGVALLGACLGGPLPASSDATVLKDTAHRQVVAQTSSVADRSAPTSDSRHRGQRSHDRGGHWAAPGRKDQGAATPRSDSTAPRSLQTPDTSAPTDGSGSSGGADNGGGSSGGGGAGGVSLPTVPPSTPSLPALPALPALPPLPAVPDVLEPVTKNVQLPPVGLP